VIDAQTEVFGIIGNPVRHSLSPAMHNAAFRALELNAVYLAFSVENLPAAVEGIRSLAVRGVNVTIPHKIAIQKLLDEMDLTAVALGSVNTVLNRQGTLVGYNTDWIGAVGALEEVTAISGKRCALLGAGGAARAVAYGLANAGGDVVVINRTEEKGRRLARQMGCGFAPLKALPDLRADILVNATSVGMEPRAEECPVPPEWLRPGMVVMDAVYAPPRTKLLQEAEARGCRVVEGLRWLVRQGAESFAIWFGTRPPEDVMERACRESMLRAHQDAPHRAAKER